MQTSYLATTALALTLVLSGCGGEGGARRAATSPVAVSSTTAAAPATPPAPVPVRTDDLEADLRAVDQELGGAQQSVNQATDTSPDRADD